MKLYVYYDERGEEGCVLDAAEYVEDLRDTMRDYLGVLYEYEYATDHELKNGKLIDGRPKAANARKRKK